MLDNRREIDVGVSYIAFVLGFDLISCVLSDSMIACDEAYDYCVKLAEEFIGSEYDDALDPVYDCLRAFVNDKLEEIEKDVEESYGVPSWVRGDR